MHSITAIALLAVFFFALCGPVYGQSELQGQPFYEMKIETVTEAPNQITIETTGAKYILSRAGMEMWRKIDPHTNSINPKKVAELAFDTDIGAFTRTSKNKGNAEITSNLLDFNFISDSFFIIKAKAPFSYTHKNLITNPPWAKPDMDKLGKGLDRMWTDGYGGSLHAWIRGNPSAGTSANETNFNMNQNDQMAHMVFPPKTFDFERLYGQGARPFVYIVYDKDQLNYIMQGNHIDELKNDGFGVFFLENGFYEKRPGQSTGQEADPVLYSIDEQKILTGDQPIADYPILGMKVNETYAETFRNFIVFAHNNGFKVITYLMHPIKIEGEGRYRWQYYDSSHSMYNVNGGFQDISITVAWMKAFQKNYSLDGWYFDNADVGDLIEDYNFIRQVRADVGDDGIIYHHDSVDVWDGFGFYRGLRAIMVDAYADYTFTGETGSISEVDSPNDPYMRYYTSGYGMSQTFGSNILTTNGKTALSEEEARRALAQNLNAVEWTDPINTTYWNYWQNYFKPAYDARKAEYLSGNFNRDVDWPVNPETGWFRSPQNIKVESIAGTCARISWETSEPSDSNVAYTSNEAWQDISWTAEKEGPDGIVANESMSTQHSILLSSLKQNTAYEFRIRSSNGENALNEIIWGHVGKFTTSGGNSACCGDNKCEAGETFATCPSDCPQECITPTRMGEYIGQWKRGEISMLTLMQKMKQWRAGTGCPTPA